MNFRPRGKRTLVALAGVAGVVAVAAVAGCGGDDSEASWLKPNADDANTRVASTSTIDAGNVADLEIASTLPLTGRGPFGYFAATPLIDESGVAYLQDLGSNVFAYDLETGEKLWEVTYDKPVIGPNGLAYEDGTVYGVTDGDVFAIDAETGEETWKKNVVDVDFGVSEGQNLGITIQPAVKDGVRLSLRGREGGRWRPARAGCHRRHGAVEVRHHRRAGG